MVDEIFPVEELPAAKRRKRWAEAHAQMELPMPSPFSWSGAIIPQVTQNHLLKIIDEGNKKVSETSMDNSRFTREDHERESKIQHTRRFHRNVANKTLLNRTVDKIEQS
ncbi:MAG: hypothetical protein JSS30_08170 [Verrucomicrobia bacterium]|nr:hypothetical protein [Verrucomicrobiota bacterium]